MNFISLSSLIFVARTSDITLNGSGKSVHSCLIPELRGKAFSVSLVSIKLTVDST